MYLRKLSMWSALGIAALVACGEQEPTGQKEALSLAQVGEEVITDRDIRYLIDNVAEWAKSEQEGGAKVREYLQSLIDRTLILREARAGKLDRSPAFVSEVATALRRRLIREIEQRAVDNQVVITEEEMRSVFAEQNWERWIKIAHIVVPTQERAEEAMAALRAGTPFEEVAREFSTHSRTASLGGVKPMYYSRFHAVPLVRDVLFSLKVGEISEPIAVPQGYEIFKVLNELQGTYEQTRDFLFKTLSEERLDARKKSYADSLAEQFQLTPDPHGLGVLMEILRSGREDLETGKKTFQIPEGAAEMPLFRYAGGQITLGEAILQSPFIRQGRDVSDSARVAHFLERDVVIPQLMWMEADKLELDRELEEWVKRKEEEVLIVTMRQIATAIDEEISEQELLDYYEETKDQYRTASEVNVVEIQLASEGEAEALLAEIRGIFRRAPPLIDLLTKMKQKQQAGRDLTEEVRALRKMDDDLEVLEWLRQRLDERGGVETVLEEIATASSPKELAEEYIMRQLASTRSLRPGASETEGHYHLYWYETARFGDLVTAAFEREIGSLIGPIQVGPSYSIAKILGRRESEARSYEERERQIRANIRKESERELFGRWLKDLRSSYEDEVRYFDDNIEKLGRELTAEGRG
ncbi:MAG: peptidyl-prolyl cis-trans isomerase [Gemmatimonadota bacterium]|nr:peptidyl-prolyl cis-trans isomerase [Gemmatimonadota bacterium]